MTGVPTVGTGRTFDECMVRKHLLSMFGQQFLGLYYDDGIAFTRILSKALKDGIRIDDERHSTTTCTSIKI